MINDKTHASRRDLFGGLAGIGALALPLAGHAATGMAQLPIDGVAVDGFLSPAQRAAALTDTPVDCTDAFVRALAANRSLTVGPGRYLLNALRLPNGARLAGAPGATIGQARADRPAIHCLSDPSSGQLADIEVTGFRAVGHPQARSPVLLVEARGAFAIWRSRFELVVEKSFRALQIEAADANNIFECTFEIRSEETSDIAVLVHGGVYNRFHLFLTRARMRALDDGSNGSSIRVVADNSIVIRGQTNQVMAVVEAIASPRVADDALITDRGFGNIFIGPQVNVLSGDKGKVRYAFAAFERTVFVSPQIIGDGVPHPFAPTSNLPFTVIGGRSGAPNKIEATFNGADPDHDLRNITFVGDVCDWTALPTRAGLSAIQRAAPVAGGEIGIAATTQILLIVSPVPLAAVRIGFAGGVPTLDGWTLSLSTENAVARIEWPAGNRYRRLPTRLAAGEAARLVFDAQGDAWRRL